jgi:hypothetical protein
MIGLEKSMSKFNWRDDVVFATTEVGETCVIGRVRNTDIHYGVYVDWDRNDSGNANCSWHKESELKLYAEIIPLPILEIWDSAVYDWLQK